MGFAYRRALLAAWREPILRVPVLILESDDWGYGPEIQARWLDRLCALLAGFSDRGGRHPVMTLGVTLAGPDTARRRMSGCAHSHRIALADPPLAPVRDAIVGGAGRGVFSIQLHGMEHYWPPSLMRAAQSDAHVRTWLTKSGFPATEDLPSPLQSRWMDASALPSKPLREELIEQAVGEEVREFSRCFGAPPRVVVPPTFAWTADVQSAWAREGIEVVVSPGQRNDRRTESGELLSEDAIHFNGARGLDGGTFVVRDDYFEPYRGHTHRDALDRFASKTYLGRPTLFEIHRANFLGTTETAERAIVELRRLLETACRHYPTLRFMSTADLADHIRRRSELVDKHLRTRIHYLLRRLGAISRLRKLAWITGAIAVAGLAFWLTRSEADGKAALTLEQR